MKVDLNVNAYRLFLHIEIGIRELLIEIIQKKGIAEWFVNFIGKEQRDTIGDIVKRNSKAISNGELPAMTDIYIEKLNKATKTIKEQSSKLDLFHPFYYLNLPDMAALIGMRQNAKLIDDYLGSTNRETIVKILNMLNNLRNDIAHSRIINEAEFERIESSSTLLNSIIPEFRALSNSPK